MFRQCAAAGATSMSDGPWPTAPPPPPRKRPLLLRAVAELVRRAPRVGPLHSTLLVAFDTAPKYKHRNKQLLFICFCGERFSLREAAAADMPPPAASPAQRRTLDAPHHSSHASRRPGRDTRHRHSHQQPREPRLHPEAGTPSSRLVPPVASQPSSSRQRAPMARSRHVRCSVTTSTTTAREPSSTPWRRSLCPRMRSSCGRVRPCLANPPCCARRDHHTDPRHPSVAPRQPRSARRAPAHAR